MVVMATLSTYVWIGKYFGIAIRGTDKKTQASPLLNVYTTDFSFFSCDARGSLEWRIESQSLL